MSTPWVTGFHDPATGTVTFVVADRASRRAAVIDPVWDYEPKSARLSTASMERLAQFVAAERLTLDWILETHVHADHLSGAQHLKERCGGRVAIGARVTSPPIASAPPTLSWI